MEDTWKRHGNLIGIESEPYGFDATRFLGVFQVNAWNPGFPMENAYHFTWHLRPKPTHQVNP